MTSTAEIPASDERMHAPTDDPQFNESMYFNAIDPERGLSTLIRMGNRVNEGYAEVTVLVYLPGGGAAIRFDRAPITSNDAFDAAGLRFEILEPLQRMQVHFDGTAYRLASGTDLEDPKRAFTSNPQVPLRLQLEYEGVIPVYGLGGDESAVGGIAGAEDSIATGHYQGPCRVSGWAEIDGERTELRCLGFRDHSWGPRKWQGPRYWRWVSCQCDERNAFVGWLTKLGDEPQPGNGMVLRDGKFSLVRKVHVASEYGPPPYYPTAMRLTMTTDEQEVVTATGTVEAMVPLRHRRDGTTARLAEALCRYDFDGKVGWGFSEYHDLIEDGHPVGMSEA